MSYIGKIIIREATAIPRIIEYEIIEAANLLSKSAIDENTSVL